MTYREGVPEILSETYGGGRRSQKKEREFFV